MTTRSAKQKGKRLQNYLRESLLKVFPSLKPEDIKSAMASEGGEDLKLSPAARRLIPYSFECKNTEKLQIWQALEQANNNARNYTPVLVFSRNRSTTYVTITLPEFLKLISQDASTNGQTEQSFTGG